MRANIGSVVADRSAIEWTEATWNPVTGCTKVSPGCAHCYAETFAERWRGVPGHPYEQGFDLRLWPERLEQPLRWRRPRMIFVNSMSDLFHERDPRRVHRARLRRHGATPSSTRSRSSPSATSASPSSRPSCRGRRTSGWASAIENRRFVQRADYLREVPAAVRFISAEPLLGPLDGLDLDGIDWLIAGGESGPRPSARPRRVAARPARPLQRRGRRVLLQAVGRPAAEVRRPAARRPDVGRDARGARAVRRLDAQVHADLAVCLLLGHVLVEAACERVPAREKEVVQAAVALLAAHLLGGRELVAELRQLVAEVLRAW